MSKVIGKVIGKDRDRGDITMDGIKPGSDLTGADLSGANLRWEHLRWANLSGAKYNRETKFFELKFEDMINVDEENQDA